MIDPTAIRTASILTDRPTELIVLDRKIFWNLHVNTGSSAINPEIYSFLSQSFLFRHWPSKSVVHLSNSIPKQHVKSQHTIGDQETLVFIVSGEAQERMISTPQLSDLSSTDDPQISMNVGVAIFGRYDFTGEYRFM